MLELLSMPVERVTFKAPRQMSGPNVYRLCRDVQGSCGTEQQRVVIDFSEVDYIDLHGLVLLRDLCELVSAGGGRTWAARVQPEMQDLLNEMKMLGRSEVENEDEYELKSA